MKRTKKAALLSLLVAVIMLVGITALVLIASAETTTEATLTVESVSYNASGVVSGTTLVSTEAGSYQQLLEKLTSLSPESATRYTLRLCGDASQTAPVTVSANENSEIRIELDGYKLTSNLGEAAITLSGSGATFRINGGYNAIGERGEVVITSESGSLVKIASGASDFADVKNVSATFVGSSLIVADGGEATLRESSVSYIGDVANCVISAKGAVASVKYVDIEGTDLSTVLYLSGAKGYIEGGYVFAGCLVESDASASHALLASVDSETVVAFKVGSSETKTYVLGGKIDISANLASGQASAENLVFYYGDGTMRLSGAGADPSAYGVQSSCSFTENEGVYTMTTSVTSVAMATTATLGEEPTVSTHSSYISGMGSDGIKRSATSAAVAPTVGINVLLKDSDVGSNCTFAGNEYVSVIVSLNGHTLTWAGTTAKSFNYAGDMHYTFSGEDVDGGRGALISNSAHQMFFYPRQSSSTGINNEQTVTRIVGTDMTVTNMGSAGSDAFININSGDLIMENCSLTYDGATLDDTTTGTAFYMFVFDHDFGPAVNALLTNVTVKSTYAGERAMNMTAFVVRSEANVYCNGVTVDGACFAATGSTANRITLIDSDIAVTEQAFSGNAAHLYDTAIVVPTGKLASTSSGMVYIHVTEKCSTTVSTGSSSLVGKYETTEEGYVLVPTADNVYELTNGVDAPEPITLPAIFASGMVFQRGKTINVFGYCADTDAELKVTLGDRVGTTKVDENGEFYVELDPMEAAWNLTLTIEQTNHALENKVVFTNVAVGEVWVMSGQSNAQLQSGYMEDVAELTVLADSVTNVRTYKSTASFTLQPSKYGSGSWDTKVNSSNMKSTSASGVSAVGLAAVFRLAEELGPDVPVALIHAARGGSPLKGWLDYETLKELSPSEAKKYEDYVANGVLDDSGRTKIGCCLYNHQIAPYEGFEVAGVMWYQGCSDISGGNIGTEGKTYSDFFVALETVYRRVFGNDDELPFYVMQLAPYVADIENLSGFKAEQYDFCSELDNTYLVSLTNEGAAWCDNQYSQGFIHPTRKSPVANRTAYAILANEYDIRYSDAYAHPDVVSVSASGSTVTVTFDTELKLLFGDRVLGFELSEDGATWIGAEGVVDGKSVILTSSASAPRYVRYAYTGIHAELEDGSIISVSSGKFDAATKTITYNSGSNSYVIDDITDLIRTMDYGNLTNVSGIPMPTFKVEIK